MDWQPNKKIASLSRSALHSDPAAVGSHKVFGNAQAKAHTLFNSLCVCTLEKRLENELLFFIRNSNPTVGKADPDFLILLTGCDFNFTTSLCVFDCIAGKISDHLCKTDLIDLNDWQVFRNYQLPEQLLFAG